MKIALITGSSGLIGSESVKFFSDKFDLIIGIDNNQRVYFFGNEASTENTKLNLIKSFPNYKHFDADIRDYIALEKIFSEYGDDIKLIVHTAAQPSHDWAAKEPFVDFNINATGTLNLLELTRKYASNSVFIFTSTNKASNASRCSSKVTEVMISLFVLEKILLRASRLSSALRLECFDLIPIISKNFFLDIV